MEPLDAYLVFAAVERGLSRNTLASYERELRRLEDDQGDLEHLTTAHLRDYIHERAGAPSTVAVRVAAVRSFYRFLHHTGRREDDPSALLERPKVKRGLPRPVSDLLTVLSTLDGETRAAAVFLAETGMRLSEALSVDLPVPAPDVVLIRGKGGRERLVPLTDRARIAIDALGGSIPIARRTLQERLKRAGITAHRLRHTLGTQLSESGADLGEIQDLLGHASPATTRIYTAYSLDRLRKAQARREARARPEEGPAEAGGA